MNYCSDCGATVSLKIPENDERMRFVCDACGMIHYQNPKIVAGVLSVWGEQVLLCRRAIAPRYGLWTLPAGFMENGETTDQAAAREAHEEANATLRDLRLYTVISVPHVSHVHVIYRCELVSDDFAPGVESLETRLFHEHEIPWDELAFHTVRKTLECFFQDRKQGVFPVHNLAFTIALPT